MQSIAEQSLAFTGLFEAEVFVRLMLWRWNHPFADDEEFANGLLEDTANALQGAVAGKQLIEGLPAKSMNFIAAVCYAEQCAVESGADRIDERKEWLDRVRRALPSCFCDPTDLQED